jgi:hypothetical protein
LKQVVAHPHPVVSLFDDVSNVLPYPTGMTAVREQIIGTAFFPGGSGLWCDSAGILSPFPFEGVMVVGQDFDNETNYSQSLSRGSENLRGPTWRNLIDSLSRAAIPFGACFFTNAYMGLRADNLKNTGPTPGLKDDKFVARCQLFFLHQVRTQRPRLIVSLGGFVPPFVASLSAELQPWLPWRGFEAIDEADLSFVPSVTFDGIEHFSCPIVVLVHPSLRHLNRPLRNWRGSDGQAAEEQLLKYAHDFAFRTPSATA